MRLPGRSTMLVRNVSDILKCEAVLDANGDPVPEGILDAVITSLIAKHDLLVRRRAATAATGSVYIVKPKMHGPGGSGGRRAVCGRRSGSSTWRR